MTDDEQEKFVRLEHGNLIGDVVAGILRRLRALTSLAISNVDRGQKTVKFADATLLCLQETNKNMDELGKNVLNLATMVQALVVRVKELEDKEEGTRRLN